MHTGVVALIRGRMAELGYRSADVGKLVYMQAASVRRKLTSRSFTAEELRDWCLALGITDPTRVDEAVLANPDRAPIGKKRYRVCEATHSDAAASTRGKQEKKHGEE